MVSFSCVSVSLSVKNSSAFSFNGIECGFSFPSRPQWKAHSLKTGAQFLLDMCLEAATIMALNGMKAFFCLATSFYCDLILSLSGPPHFSRCLSQGPGPGRLEMGSGLAAVTVPGSKLPFPKLLYLNPFSFEPSYLGCLKTSGDVRLNTALFPSQRPWLF